MHFKWTIIELMKYYLNVYDHNSCISNGHELFSLIIILMYVIIINVFQMDINCILMKYYFNV